MSRLRDIWQPADAAEYSASALIPRPISPTHISPSEILSFRHILVDALHEFLKHEHLDFKNAASGVGQVLEQLAKYQEEGTRLYPSVFLCDDLEPMLIRLGAIDHHALGSGPLEPATMLQALKRCAPLCRDGWSIYMVKCEDRLDYGVFLTNDFVLNLTSMARMRALSDPEVHIVGLVQLADNVLELRGSSGSRRLIYLSGTSTDTLPAIALLWSLTGVIAHHVAPELAERVRNLLQRVFIDAMRTSHGLLMAVLPRNVAPREVFSDLIVLDRPINLPELVLAYDRARTESSHATLQGAGRLLEGMLGVDGIVVLTSDASVVGYNAFLHFSGTDLPTVATGGARRRTYEALGSMVGQSLVGAFVRSQDGAAGCRTAHPKSPLFAP